ncbi:ricin-type beta-trefoil lectin domain protein [Saccharothrix sp. 6-C]|uniref:RICIN domain-containing protein n=1 Tax=Saccharothrix sp. 6-C TaxID=2781735 RepID=UPI00191737BD|nr:ricin-type beta-trefoil lectin domain protein [Saccharothrix sp. 6-C]QQQ74530.1 ricin-type beta-trefoil lectin domain protein [Saccharothrix sp. 6-C]
MSRLTLARLAAVLFAAVAAVVVVVSPAQAGPADGNPVEQAAAAESAEVYRMTNHYTNRCAAVHGPSNVNGGAVFQIDCNPAFADQYWRWEPYNGSYRLRNEHTNRCLAVQQHNAPAFQIDCGTYTDQQWVRQAYYSGNYLLGYKILNVYSGKCLAVQGAVLSNTQVFQAGCNTSYLDQVWELQI